MVADKLLMAARRILPLNDPWSPGALVDIATENGLERRAKVIGPSASGDALQRRVEFTDGVVDDWDVADFRKPWAVGDVVDIDTEDGLERGATVLGPSDSRDASELRIRFQDGTVDDWATDDFRRPPEQTEFAIGSKQAVVQHICNAGTLVYAVAGVKGGRELIDECKSYGVGLTVTAADLQLPITERAAKGREEMKAALNALRASENPAYAQLGNDPRLGDDAIGKAVLTPEGAQKVLKMMGEREFPSAYVAAAKKREKIEPIADAVASSSGGGMLSSFFGSTKGGFDTSADDGGGWGGGCEAAAAAVTADIGCDFDRRFVSENGGEDGGLTPAKFVSEYVAKMKPVILRAKTAKGLLQDWGAWTAWSRQGMLERYGSVEVNISASSSIVKLRQGGDNNAETLERTVRQAKLADYIQNVMGRSASDPSVLQDKDPPYLFRARQLPNLDADYEHIDLFNDTSIFHHDKVTRERIALFFVGPGNSGAYFHQHMNAYNALIYGAKRWFLLPPQADKGEEQPSMSDW